MSDATELRPIVVVESYEQLHEAFRDRAVELDFSRLTIDHVAGWANGSAGKYLSPESTKQEVDRSNGGLRSNSRRFGIETLGDILSALGLKLIVCEDPEATARAKVLASWKNWRSPRRQRRVAAVDEQSAAA